MAETAPKLSPPADEVPPLAFADLDGAKKWAKSLPLLPVAQAYAAVIGQLRALAGATLPPRERATLTEVFREPVFHLHTELARRYAGKPQPTADRGMERAYLPRVDRICAPLDERVISALRCRNRPRSVASVHARTRWW